MGSGNTVREGSLLIIMAMQESPGRPGARTPRTDEYADVAGRVTWIGDQDTDGDMRLWAALNSLTEMSELA